MRVVNNRAEQYQTLNLTSSSSKSSKKTKTVLTELFVAASIGDAPAVDFYLRIVGIAVDASDVRGWRPIHHAALHGQTKVVELLIRRGANVNCCTVSGITPILLCSSCLTARYDTMRLVQTLLRGLLSLISSCGSYLESYSYGRGLIFFRIVEET